MRAWRAWRVGGMVWALVWLTACAQLSGALNRATLPPPTPMGDTLALTAPTFSIELLAGRNVPGTQLYYLRQRDNAYEVSIDGQTILKRPGDSFAWRGVVAPGVYGVYNLRLQPIYLSNLQALGSVELTILNPTPVEVFSLAGTTAPIYFPSIPIDYRVPAQRVIPGTNYVYMGLTGDFVQLARVGEGVLPLYAVGDTLVWQGRLRDNVTARFDLVIGSAESDGALNLRGSATVWIRPILALTPTP